MGESNDTWGELAETNRELAAMWDGYKRLPEEGENVVLDAFCKRKNITIASLVRTGARLVDDTTLAFGFSGGIKYRELVTDKRWNSFGAEFDRLKLVRHGGTPTAVCLVAEGETDAARLALHYDADVAILPAGARRFIQSFADQLKDYEIVCVGLDNDEAGKHGTAKIMEFLPQAVPFHPPEGNDWCELDTGRFPELPTEVERDEPRIIVNARDLLELPEPSVVSYYENALLPVGGLMMLHGWAKSFKTFAGIDLIAMLAQSQPWAGFEPTEEPVKGLVIQYELPWPFYRQRVLQLQAAATDPEAFGENFLSYSPLSRPKLMAGNTKSEDFVLKACVDAGVQVVLLDPVRRATGTIDMNAEAEVRKMLAFFERMNDYGITVIATHHDNKTAGRGGGGDPTDMTGSGAWAGDPDTIVSVELPPGENHRTSVKRNLNFTLRNAPAVPSRGFIMTDTGLEYVSEPWGDVADEDPTAPSI